MLVCSACRCEGMSGQAFEVWKYAVAVCSWRPLSHTMDRPEWPAPTPLPPATDPVHPSRHYLTLKSAVEIPPSPLIV